VEGLERLGDLTDLITAAEAVVEALGDEFGVGTVLIALLLVGLRTALAFPLWGTSLVLSLFPWTSWSRATTLATRSLRPEPSLAQWFKIRVMLFWVSELREVRWTS
jgi:hypothetical protein